VVVVKAASGLDNTRLPNFRPLKLADAIRHFHMQLLHKLKVYLQNQGDKIK